jgi:hypothetical protein
MDTQIVPDAISTEQMVEELTPEELAYHAEQLEIEEENILACKDMLDFIGVLEILKLMQFDLN